MAQVLKPYTNLPPNSKLLEILLSEVSKITVNLWKAEHPRTDLDLTRINAEALAAGLTQMIEKQLDQNAVSQASRHIADYFQDEDDGRHQPLKEWLTREEAAQYLAFSRTTLNKMLNDGKLTFRTREVGNRKLLLTQDVIGYKQELLHQLDAVKSEMVNDAQELGMYDVNKKAS
jgi:excisionase family DNA binding protein